MGGRRGAAFPRCLLAALLCLAFLEMVSAQSVIFVARHAEKETTSDHDPALSANGRKRAEALQRLLTDADIRAIYVTEWQRTQETAAPLARALRLKPKIVPAAQGAMLLTSLQKETGNVLVIGHSNTIPELLRALGLSPLPAIEEDEYDSFYVVFTGPPPRVVHLHY